MPEILGTLRPPRLGGVAAPPISPALGEMYYDTATNTLYWWDSTAWVSARGGTGGQAFPPSGDVPFGGFKATGLGYPTASGDAASKLYVDTQDIAQSVRGTYAARPAAGTQGRTYFATDTGAVYFDDTVQWRTVTPPLLAALPAGPTNSDEIYLQSAAMATAGVVWHMRYRSATSKWEYVGGTPMYDDNASSAGGGAGIWTDVATTFAIPVAGLYRIQWGGQLSAAPNTAYVWHVGVVLPGGTNPAADAEAIFAGPSAGAASAGGNVAREFNKTLTAGTIKLQGKLDGFTVTYTNTYLRVTPITL